MDAFETAFRQRADELHARCVKALQQGADDAEVDALVAEVKQLQQVKQVRDDEAGIVRQMEEMRAAAAGPLGQSSLSKAVAAAGFDVKARPSVTVSGFASFGEVKAPTVPNLDTLSPTRPELVGLGSDRRFLFPVIPRENAGTDTAITDFKHTARSVTGDVERALDAVTEKAELGLTITHTVEPLRQLAVMLRDVPNIVLAAAPSFRRLFDRELTEAIDQALDTHVVARIAAADVPFGSSGADLVARVRNAVSSMREAGATPQVLALSPADAAGLDLYTDAGGLVFATRSPGSGSPLWGLRVVEIPRGTDPLLIDPQRLGTLYLGTLAIEADPYSKFSTNQTDLRCEVSALMHVRDATGAFRIGSE